MRLTAERARTYDVRATLSGLGTSWEPCRVEADGRRVGFAYGESRRVLRFTAPVASAGEVRVTACR
ncbi:hypothetical protein [Nocardioides sp. T2.26MG-1]|uniref:hypothetical protein n=1 Tax=Nocardioides sp. T2.26MG-1 TaxID=3041166 RepID=UPI00247732BC|nr:hypothetical protein [Nocardioides sp. T2.26MG-1]CAI9407417.1 hypothetical protein HIDPHFAB_04779 [Nocardioides sp. T2.26MG-1]